MNFVDYLLTDANAVNIHDIITDIAEIWNTVTHGLSVDDFVKHPQYIKDLVYILNFDGVCTWDGLDAFVSDGDRELFDNTVKAFENIGYEPAVKILREVLGLDEVQSFYNNHSFFIKRQTLSEIAVLECRLQAANYSTAMWARLERYVIKAHLESRKTGATRLKNQG